MINPNGLLMIEPRLPASAEPLIDELTEKMTEALRCSRLGLLDYRGVHRCVCGARGDSRDHFVGELVTNSLAVHYLAFHREEVPESELEKVRALEVRGVHPASGDLKFPLTLVSKENR